jgi:hypothetical protein
MKDTITISVRFATERRSMRTRFAATVMVGGQKSID